MIQSNCNKCQKVILVARTKWLIPDAHVCTSCNVADEFASETEEEELALINPDDVKIANKCDCGAKFTELSHLHSDWCTLMEDNSNA
jgi:hypothetical protein